MWLFNAPPKERLQQNHNFELTQPWLDRLMRGSVRFNNGGSGAFVSPTGLVVTNHHIGADSLQKVSTPKKDFVQDGFLARTPDKELKCPDLELNALQSIEDVTDKVNASVKPEMTPEQAGAARRAVMSTLEKESADKTGLRSDVVTLYQGGAYHLYRYKKYTDVRLVMAPEQGLAFFGGDTDNFEYPRYCLDVAFFRVYENGKPLNSTDYLPWSQQGAKEGDLVFVVGNPGTTNRIDTLARLLHLRDHTIPYRLQQMRSEEATLRQYAEKGSEPARQAQKDIYSVSNGRKAYTGQFQGLLNDAIIDRKRQLEASLRQRSGNDAPWVAIEKAQQALTPFEKEYYLFELGQAVDSDLFAIARHLVRLQEELKKPSAQRLREYRDSNLESLKLGLFSPAPIEKDLERVKLASSLQLAAEQLGADHPVVKILLNGQPPARRAAELIGSSSLNDPQHRKAIFEGTATDDPLIQLARAIDPASRKLRTQYETLVDEPQKQAYAQIANAMFRLDGPAQPPDATFTLRLSYGVVKGYQAEGHAEPWHTTFAGLFKTAKEHKNVFPFHLPQQWLKAEKALNLSTPLDFVSTADTIGGNSGSPVVNREGQVVGVNFDRNRYGLVRNFLYSEEQARHIAVHSKAVLEALAKVYHATELLNELETKK